MGAVNKRERCGAAICRATNALGAGAYSTCEVCRHMVRQCRTASRSRPYAHALTTKHTTALPTWPSCSIPGSCAYRVNARAPSNRTTVAARRRLGGRRFSMAALAFRYREFGCCCCSSRVT